MGITDYMSVFQLILIKSNWQGNKTEVNRGLQSGEEVYKKNHPSDTSCTCKYTKYNRCSCNSLYR